MSKIKVMNTEISVQKVNGEDYISLTDMLKAKDGAFFIADWLRNRNTLEYIGIWEKVYNPNFNYGEFATITNQSGLNSFKISVKEFVERTEAISIISKAGRYGGTYAHKDIAFEFAMWISAEFKIYIVKEFQRLKAAEQAELGWSVKRETSIVYASEADVLNMALFGFTAAEWRTANPTLPGNVRDYATVNQLICLSNMESLNSVLINEGLPQSERLVKLNQIAISQMTVLESIGQNKLLR